MVHQTPRRIKNAAEIYNECTLIWKHTGFAGHGAGMKMLNINIKDIYHDQFNNSNIHSINFARSANDPNIAELLFCKKLSNIKYPAVKCV